MDWLNWFNRLLYNAVVGVIKVIFRLDRVSAMDYVDTNILKRFSKKEDNKNG